MVLNVISVIWDKVLKNGPSKICGSHPLKNLKGYDLLKLILLGPFLNNFSHLTDAGSEMTLMSNFLT